MGADRRVKGRELAEAGGAVAQKALGGQVVNADNAGAREKVEAARVVPAQEEINKDRQFLRKGDDHASW